MRIAVAYQDGEIYEHFGHARLFAIYDYEGADVTRCTKKLVETGERHGHRDMAELMRTERVDAVIAGNMGGEAKALLLSYGIVPVAGYSGDADTAADLLVTGQLPITPGEGGGCSSCAGNCSCGSDGGEGCSCGGCGCGC